MDAIGFSSRMRRGGVTFTVALLLAQFAALADFSGHVPGPPPPPTLGARGRLEFDSVPVTGGVPRQDAQGFANLALLPEAAAVSSSAMGGYAIHKTAHLNDGASGNENSWISGADPSWAEIDLGGAYWVYKVAFASDASGRLRDRGAMAFSIQTAAEGGDAEWTTVYTHGDAPVHTRETFVFEPVQARRVRIVIDTTSGGLARIDEIEIYGQAKPISPDAIAVPETERPDAPAPPGPAVMAAAPTHGEQLHRAFLGEEHAWLKTCGRADLSPRLVPYNGRVKEHPHHVGDDRIPLPALPSAPKLDGVLDDDCWQVASSGSAQVAHIPANFDAGALVNHAVAAGHIGGDLYLGLRFDRLLSSHIAIVSTTNGRGCGVITITKKGIVFAQYEARGNRARLVDSQPLDGVFSKDFTTWEVRLPLSLFRDWEKRGLRIGLGMGGKHTPATGRALLLVDSDIFVNQAGPCIDGEFRMRLGVAASPKGRGRKKSRAVEVRGNAPALKDGLALSRGEPRERAIAADRGGIGPEYELKFEDGRGERFVVHLFQYDAMGRTLDLFEDMVERFAVDGMDVNAETETLRAFRKRHAKLTGKSKTDHKAQRSGFLEARMAKRDLFMRAPQLAAAQRILFAKRRPFEPSHNYSVILDARFRPGGSVCRLDIPLNAGRLAPEQALATSLFESKDGIARTPAADYGRENIYFAYRPSEEGYYHIMAMDPDGGHLRQLTDGPFHDYWPCPLPDGDLAVISTRCRQRFLCWRPQAFVLFRMNPDGGGFQPLSYANLSEWAPSVMNDGRIVWTRSEYQDKGADFGHTLWAIRPDGTKPELVFGNDIIQPNGYANGREVPGTHEFSCTLISHFGDLNGPIALVDTAKGRFAKEAITSLTPEVPWPGMWPIEECFRDPVPLARDYFLCSHAPQQRFHLFVIDRFGNRELLYADPAISSMCPTPLLPQEPPPVLAARVDWEGDTGEFMLHDVYAGISPPVERGTVKYLRVVEEVRAHLDEMPDGGYRADHPTFEDWYASPVHKVSGPNGWTTYVAKAPHGLVPVEEDGSAHFTAPAGKVLYFQVLDKDLNELQRMRSVVQLQPGEKRSCVGCHDSREGTPVNKGRPMAQGPAVPQVAAWGGEPLFYERVVQPVFDNHCTQCHDANHKKGIDLRGHLDAEKVPASYRTLVEKGLVHYADMGYNSGGCEKAPPLSLGTVKSKLWEVLDAGHHDVDLDRDEMRRIKTWIDLNCPLWGDYVNRGERPSAQRMVTASKR